MKVLILFVILFNCYNIFGQENNVELDGLNLGDVIPTFLVNGTEDAKNEYKNIINSHTFTINDIKQKIQDLVDTQDDDIKNAYNEVKIKGEEMEEEFKANMTAAAANLPEDAKPFFEKIQQVVENGDLSLSGIQSEIANIASEIPNNDIKNEIAKVFPIHIVSQTPLPNNNR
uniref:DUF148 domain-containing protein n=1 Tax=Strongyloides papillosus TaxID=174720 RepID=A0A0N5B9U8_STREA